MKVVVSEEDSQITKVNQVRLQVVREVHDIFGAYILIDHLQPLSCCEQSTLLLYSRTSERDCPTRRQYAV